MPVRSPRRRPAALQQRRASSTALRAAWTGALQHRRPGSRITWQSRACHAPEVQSTRLPAVPRARLRGALSLWTAARSCGSMHVSLQRAASCCRGRSTGELTFPRAARVSQAGMPAEGIREPSIMRRMSIPILILMLAACFLLCATASAQSIVEKAKRDEVSFVAPDDPDPDMVAAFDKARATLDQFLAMAKAPPASVKSVAVKVAVVDGADREYFWIAPFSETAGGYSGTLNNQPRLVSNVTPGTQLRFRRNEIVDWMYIDSARAVCMAISRPARF